MADDDVVSRVGELQFFALLLGGCPLLTKVGLLLAGDIFRTMLTSCVYDTLPQRLLICAARLGVYWGAGVERSKVRSGIGLRCLLATTLMLGLVSAGQLVAVPHSGPACYACS